VRRWFLINIINKENPIKTKTDYFEYVLISLFPILALYDCLPAISIGQLILLIMIIIRILKHKLYSKINFKILTVMLMLMIINLFVGISRYPDLTNTINNTVAMLIFTFLACFICSSSYLDKEKLYKIAKLIGIVTTLFLFYQFISYYFFDTVVKGDIKFLNPIEKEFISIEYGRPTSFFFEPAHYAIYVAPIYAVSLVKRETFFSLLLLLGMILSTSSTGLVIALAIPILIFFNPSKNTFAKRLIILITIIIISMVLAYTFNFSATPFEKISIANLRENVRVFGTIDYFNFFDTKEWLFGVGINRLKEFILINHGLHVANYANSYLFSIFSFGLIGGVIWILYNIALYKNVLLEYKSLYYILIMISISDQILFNRNLFYLLIWIHMFSEKDE